MHRFAWLIAIMALVGCATPAPTLTKEADAGMEWRLQRVEDMGFTDVILFNRGGDMSQEHIFELVT